MVSAPWSAALRFVASESRELAIRMEWWEGRVSSIRRRPLVETLPMQRRTAGINYLRLASTAEEIDTAGLLIESMEASKSA
jgi:hypothetical protein